jgi:hypothetical protein
MIRHRTLVYNGRSYFALYYTIMNHREIEDDIYDTVPLLCGRSDRIYSGQALNIEFL